MDPSRAARYVDKVNHGRERAGLVAEWWPQAEKSLQVRLATYKAFQEAVEAATDLAAMAVVDGGRAAKDDYSNYDAAVGLGVCEPSLVAPLREATSLRNRLVHQYDGIETRPLRPWRGSCRRSRRSTRG